jgi:transcriptional regulator with PAS, ATPase and Fis domain
VRCSTIAATNRNLKALVKKKRFREDLYYRLASFILELPPLRERPEDIAGLVRYFLNKYNRQYRSDKKIQSAALQTLQQYGFPGNIRELKNIIENAVVMSDAKHIDIFVLASLHSERAAPASKPTPQHEGSLRLSDRLGEVERALLRQVQLQCRNTREMAAVLGISQPSVVRKLRKHNLGQTKMQK